MLSARNSPEGRTRHPKSVRSTHHAACMQQLHMGRAVARACGVLITVLSSIKAKTSLLFQQRAVF
jgi:hypothetical protein